MDGKVGFPAQVTPGDYSLLSSCYAVCHWYLIRVDRPRGGLRGVEIIGNRGWLDQRDTNGGYHQRIVKGSGKASLD